MFDFDVPSARFMREHHRATGVDLALRRGPDGEALPRERQLICQFGWQSPRTAVRFYLLGQYQDHVLQEWLKAKGST
ncbi:MAG: hypothetical protein WAV00_07110 [Nocardioides sp.]